MNVKVVNKVENKLLARKEVEAQLSYRGATPKRTEMREELAKKISCDPDLLVLREVKNEYGIQRVKVVAHAYENKEQLEKVEPEYIRKRDGLLGEKKAEEKKEGEE